MNDVYREIEQHIPHLRRYARAIAHNPVAADDLVQESLLRALSKSHLYRPGTNLRAWLFTILHNQHVSDMRRNSRTGIPVDPDDAAPALATRPNQETRLVMRSLERALQSLPDNQRILIELVALDDRSYEDVARAYGLPLGTVKSRISRGRSQLREVLEGRSRLSHHTYPKGRVARALLGGAPKAAAAGSRALQEGKSSHHYPKAA